jgi:hypothetical protein
MGGELPRFHQIAGHCLFVGNRGCRLIARYSFCVNYLCPRLKTHLGGSRVSEFLFAAGDELFKGWELERALLKWLHQHSVDRAAAAMSAKARARLSGMSLPGFKDGLEER